MKLNILWLNWKDIRHPQAGGAEIYTHQIAKRLAKKGHQITLFTSQAKDLPKQEEIDGIQIIRQGKIIGIHNTVYQHAKKYIIKNQDNYDIIIDEINTKPFMTPKYTKKPITALIHQLAKEYWFHKTPLPIAIIGRYILEPYWLKQYRNIPTITVSQSTKQDLQQLGFNKIHIVPNGLNYKPLEKVPEKDEEFTAVFLGRITPTKNPEHAIKAFLEYRKTTGKGRLIVIGQGEQLPKLKRKYREPYIEFTGYVSEKEKREWLTRAHVLLAPSIREGWGQAIIEANAHGTPAIGYDVPGLRDSIRHMKTGILVPYGDIRAMAKAMTTLSGNQELWRKMAENALQWARQFSWDKSAEKFEEIVSYIVLKSQPWLGSYNVTSLLKQLL